MKLTNQEKFSSQEWYSDSAASAHTTNNSSKLYSSEQYVGNDQVIVSNGDFLPITHVVSIAFQTPQGTMLPLYDVSVCPKITKNLLIVYKLTKDYPCELNFDSDHLFVKDKVTEALIQKIEDLWICIS